MRLKSSDAAPEHTANQVDEPGKDGHTVERLPPRHMIYVVAITLLTRSGSVLGLLALTPLLTRSLGTEAYGVIVTIATLNTLVMLADLGIGNGLISHLARCEPATPEAMSLIRGAIASLAAMGVAACLFAGILAIAVPWERLIKTKILDSDQISLCVGVCLVAATLAIPVSIGQKIDIARQRGHKVAIWTSASSIGAPASAWGVSSATSNLVLIALTFTLVPCVILAVRTLTVLRAEKIHLGSLRECSRAQSRESVKTGIPFFGLAIFSGISSSMDTLMVSAILGAKEAGQFSITLRVFGVVNVILQGALTQLWGAFAKALHDGEYEWARRTLIRTTLLCLIGGVCVQLSLIFIANQFMATWLGVDYSPPMELLIVTALWSLYSFTIQPLSMFLNGAGLQRKQLMIAVPVLFVNVPASIYLTHKLGSSGPLLGSLIANAVILTPPLVILARKCWHPIEQVRLDR